MAKGATRTSKATTTAGDAPRTRLTAEARRSSILKAARRAFSETGDMNGTTIRAIADRGGISEGVIYRHFDSKEQLFYEAVVEPLREAVDALVAATEVVDRDVSGYIVASIDEAVAAVEQARRLDRRRCRDTFERRFTAERMARDYLRIYRELSGGAIAAIADQFADQGEVA